MLAIGLATRGRPDLLRETVKRTLDHIELSDTRLYVLADEDDETMRAWVFKDLAVEVHRAPREDSLGGKYNRLLRLEQADVYMTMVDYAPHVTKGFDRKIMEAAGLFPDGIGVIYNHMANLSFPALNAVTDGFVRRLGYFYPEYFPYWFVDHWLDDIARMIGRIAVADVHVDVQKRPGTQEQREPGLWASLFDALTFERRKDAFRLIDDLCDPTWKKALLKNAAPLIEERSQIINRMVRGIKGTDQSTDERYERVRARGLEKLQQTYYELERKAA